MVEFQADVANFASPALGPNICGLFHASPLVEDNDYTESFCFTQGVDDIPTVTPWGLLLLSALLSGAGLFALRRVEPPPRWSCC